MAAAPLLLVACVTTPAPPPPVAPPPVPPEPAAEPTVVPEPEPEPEPVAVAPVTPVFPPERDGPFKVLILGDSMAATDFGVALEARLDAHPKVVCARRGKSSSGLARPDFFDWSRAAQRQLAKHAPDLVVVILGGNDGQDLRARADPAERVRWGDAGWADAYRDRLRSFAESLIGPERRLLWIGLPAMDHRNLEGKLKTIRSLQREALDPLGESGTYLDTEQFFYDEEGALLRQVSLEGYRRPQPLRQDDGIHFSLPGAAYFADRVAPAVLGALGLDGR